MKQENLPLSLQRKTGRLLLVKQHSKTTIPWKSHVDWREERVEIILGSLKEMCLWLSLLYQRLVGK